MDLQGIKSKFGIGRKADAEEYYDDYDDYGNTDYGEYGNDESRDAPGSRYDPYDSVTAREVGGRASSVSSTPRLVSLDDVRATTQVPSYSSDSTARRSRSSSFSSSRTMVDSSLPPQMTPEGTAAAANAASAAYNARSEGLNSLFEPTASAREDRAESSAASTAASSNRAASSFSAAASAAATLASPASTPLRSASSRSVKVIKPLSYNEAEAVSVALKLGDAVVISLSGTPDALAKRVLDFSFGVACAFEASVECVGERAFAITRGEDLSEGERAYLRSQGII